MDAIKVDLSKDLKSIELHTFADLHIGDKNCDIETIKNRIDYIKSKDNAFCILNGDIINNATKTSVSDCYAEELSPMEQIERFVELFEPIKNKIIAITQGNHEKRTYNKEGIDITFLCAKQLGLSSRYAPIGAVIFLRFGTQSKKAKKTNKQDEIRGMCYTIYCTHGSGGGRKEGAKAIRLADMSSIVDVDIYIHSHTHLPMVMKQAFHRVDTRNSAISIVDKLFVNTSSSLNYGGYGQAFEFKPNSKDTPVIYLNGTKKEFTAKL